MSDVFEVVEGARPDVDPIPPDDRRRIREELFHDGRRTPDATAEAAMVVPWQTRRRSRQLVVVVALLVVAGLVALYVLRDEDADTTDEQVVPASTSAPSASAPSGNRLPFEFTPMLLASPPEGYRLHWARYEGNRPADTVGLARYVGPPGEPEIAILLRAEPGAYTGRLEEGTETWRVKGRRIAAEPASGLCIDSSCGVNVQWDDDTALSVSWVNWDRTSLNAEVTHERLVDLVRDITPRPKRWKPGSIDQDDATWDVPDPDTAPLVLPVGDAPIVSANHAPPWPGASSLAVRAPDGSVLTLREGDGGATDVDQRDLVRQGSVSVTPPPNRRADPLQYELAVRCGFAHVADEPGRAVLRPTMQELLESMTVDRGEIEIQLRDGWSRLGAGPHTDVYEVVFDTRVGGRTREVALRQSPGGTTSDLLYGRGPLEEISFAGAPAWRHDGVRRTSVTGSRAGTPFEISARDVTVAQLETVFERLQPATLEEWEARWGTSSELAADTDCPQQPFFVVRRAG